MDVANIKRAFVIVWKGSAQLLRQNLPEGLSVLKFTGVEEHTFYKGGQRQDNRVEPKKAQHHRPVAVHECNRIATRKVTVTRIRSLEHSGATILRQQHRECLNSLTVNQTESHSQQTTCRYLAPTRCEGVSHHSVKRAKLKSPVN